MPAVIDSEGVDTRIQNGKVCGQLANQVTMSVFSHSLSVSTGSLGRVIGSLPSYSALVQSVSKQNQ